VSLRNSSDVLADRSAIMVSQSLIFSIFLWIGCGSNSRKCRNRTKFRNSFIVQGSRRFYVLCIM
jgi:hypothetical protein